jgi:hypothetical protein
MKQHAAYWKDRTERGMALVYWPVLDHKGAYGLGIIEVDNDDHHALKLQIPRRSNPGLMRSKSNRCEQLWANGGPNTDPQDLFGDNIGTT